jgi:CO dehydrogenase nickel-insertion accessory protein CooC1
MKVIVIANQKGGSGKSVFGTQLAFCVAEFARKRVAYLDTDEQSNSTYTLHSCEAGNRAHEFFGETPVQVKGGLPITLFSAELEHALDSFHGRLLVPLEKIHGFGSGVVCLVL